MMLGFTWSDAATSQKLELGALIEACRRQHIRCACVMHGHGKNILKQKIPLWLASASRYYGISSGAKTLGRRRSNFGTD